MFVLYFASHFIIIARSWLGGSYNEQRISMGDLMLTCQTKYLAFEETIRRVPAAKPTGLFRTSISQTTKKEKRAIPFVITSAVREVERRGITEVGIYRVSGSATDMARLKVRDKFESLIMFSRHKFWVLLSQLS